MSINRRDFISTTLRFASVSGFVGSASILQAAEHKRFKDSELMLLYRENDNACHTFAAYFQDAGISALALAEDPVRQWRDVIAGQIQMGTLLVGIGTWADFIMARGLAAEMRRFPLVTMQHSLSDQAEWAVMHADELLQLGKLEEQQQFNAVLTALAQRSAPEPANPSLFSWVIG